MVTTGRPTRRCSCSPSLGRAFHHRGMDDEVVNPGLRDRHTPLAPAAFRRAAEDAAVWALVPQVKDLHPQAAASDVGVVGDDDRLSLEKQEGVEAEAGAGFVFTEDEMLWPDLDRAARQPGVAEPGKDAGCAGERPRR